MKNFLAIFIAFIVAGAVVFIPVACSSSGDDDDDTTATDDDTTTYPICDEDSPIDVSERWCIFRLCECNDPAEEGITIEEGLELCSSGIFSEYGSEPNYEEWLDCLIDNSDCNYNNDACRQLSP